MKQHSFFNKLELILPIIIVNSFGLIGFFFYLPRSIFYYEFAIVLLALVYGKRSIYACIIFVLIFLFDLLNLFSSIYLFSISDFLINFKFGVLYKITLSQVLSFIVLLGYIFFVLFILVKYQSKVQRNKSFFYKLLFVVYFSVIVFDFLNGSSKVIKREKIFSIVGKNISSPLLKEYFSFLHYYRKSDDKKLMHKRADTSVTFKLLAKDSSKRQLLVLMESWGYINDPVVREAFQHVVNEKLKLKSFKHSWGQTRFVGSTTSAEMREMMNLEGNYNFFIGNKSDQSDWPSIFDMKKKAGYDTYGFHAYTGKMFAREIWWKNVGLNHIFFRDDVISSSFIDDDKLDRGTPFLSAKDEFLFDFMLKKTDSISHKFVYLLTVNSHLPFAGNFEQSDAGKKIGIASLPLSQEAKSQLSFILNQLFYFISKIDDNKWDDVLFVGDHIPPYLIARDRSFFSAKQVPYLFLSR